IRGVGSGVGFPGIPAGVDPAGVDPTSGSRAVPSRIHKNMLLDLTRELMKELGITAVGDVIAILRHAKVVHRQEMCRAASESLQPEAERGPGGSWRDREDRDQDRDQERDQERDQRDRACAAAGRMISHSLRREPRQPRGTPGTGICVTVPNGADGPGAQAGPGRRRRVTAEMEGKYRISLPKGSTARSRRILQLQAASGIRGGSRGIRGGSRGIREDSGGGFGGSRGIWGDPD
ncbi:PREDICTED: uncharacterized protein C19orf47 homolog, partial [Pseudopodoces humilis]|uniref:uncharacterized protein C19orf47 homolog n=1 Tax=Pseudopodoces humilis TaxID=181119 RepID=UPI0006B6C045